MNTFQTEISDIDTSHAVAFDLRCGQCSLHDGRIRHGRSKHEQPQALGVHDEVPFGRSRGVPRKKRRAQAMVGPGQAAPASGLFQKP